MGNRFAFVAVLASALVACTSDDPEASGAGASSATSTGPGTGSDGAGGGAQGVGGAGVGGATTSTTSSTSNGTGGVEVPTLTVDAGDDVTIALPAREVELTGAATTTDGSTPELRWEAVAGTDATLAGEATSTLSLSGLVPGTYTFRLTATDATGAAASDDVDVTVTSTGQTFYVAETGNDGTIEDPVDGSAATPWRTLAHACAAVPGDADHVIHVAAGDYVEVMPCELKPRVSLEGEGEATHVIPADTAENNPYGASLKLASTTGGTDGSQTISDLWLDGADVTHRAIVVHGRSRVLVRHVRFTTFLSSAVALIPIGTWGQAPPVFERGNEVSSSTFTDCSDRGASGGGVILMGGQDGAVIRDDVFSQVGREKGRNGNVMGAVYGHNRGWKYFRNVSSKPVDDGPHEGAGGRGWNFALEVWNNEGGTEIWGNTFNGGGNAIDIGGSQDLTGDYDTSWFIHDNVFQLDAQLATTPTQWLVPMAVQFEVPASDAVVSHNRFRRLGHGVQIILSHDGNGGTSTERVSIHNNVFEEMGIADGSLGGTMINIGLSADAVIGSIHIDNNTMLSGTSGHARAALMMTNTDPDGVIGPIDFRNNIVEHGRTWGYITFNGSSLITDVTSSHNIVNDNLNDYVPPDGDDNTFVIHETTSLDPSKPTVVDYSGEADNLVVDPELGPDLHPLPGSPAFGAGLDVGYGTTIGAFAE